MSAHIRFAILLTLLILLAGCAYKGELLTPESDAASRWQTFVQRSMSSDRYDMLSGSLRFGKVNDTRRITYTLWSGESNSDAGNTDIDGNRVVRLEVNAGVGVNIAKALFKYGQMTIVLPQEQKVFIGTESPENLRQILGISLPLRMEALDHFFAGREFIALDSPQPERYQTGKDGNIIYQYRSNGRNAEIELNEQALPVRWSVSGYWTLDITYDNAQLPYRLSGHMNSTEGDFRMILLVKDRLQNNNLLPDRFHLEIPTDFPVYSLERQ